MTLNIRNTICLLALIGTVPVGGLADTPGEPYTVKLGPGNEDLEEQINAIPWTRLPGVKTIRAKDVSQVDFSGRDLRMAVVHFRLDALQGACFDDCCLDGSTFRETELINCSFRNASLRHCELERAFSRFTSWANDFSNADITGSYYAGFSGQELRQTKNFQARTLAKLELCGDFSGLSFRTFVLENVRYWRSSCTLTDCDFTDARLVRTIVSGALSPEQIYATRNYQERDLTEILFCQVGSGDDARAAWDFSKCNLAYFLHCDLRNADFNDAFFVHARGNQIDFLSIYDEPRVARFYQATQVKQVGFDNCQITEAQLRKTVNWKKKDLRNMHLKNMNLDGWDFSGMELEGADLGGSSLEGANFDGARLGEPGAFRLDGCRGLKVAQLLECRTAGLRTEGWRDRARKGFIEIYRNVDFADLTKEEGLYQHSLQSK